MRKALDVSALLELAKSGHLGVIIGGPVRHGMNTPVGAMLHMREPSTAAGIAFQSDPVNTGMATQVLPIIKGKAPAAQMAFVALDPATGRGLEKIVDRAADQAVVSRVVLDWIRSGAKVKYMTAELADPVPEIV